MSQWMGRRLSGSPPYSPNNRNESVGTAKGISKHLCSKLKTKELQITVMGPGVLHTTSHSLLFTVL